MFCDAEIPDRAKRNLADGERRTMLLHVEELAVLRQFAASEQRPLPVLQGCFRVLGPKSESLENICTSFPFWFTPRLKEFVGRETELPFDQHSVKALIAPRALLTTEALADANANPIGTWQTHRAAREVYTFLGHPERIAIAYRVGGHEHTPDDFNALLDFADQVFFDKPAKRNWSANPFPDLPPAYSWTAPAR